MITVYLRYVLFQLQSSFKLHIFAHIELLVPDNNFDIVAMLQIPKFRLPINTKKHDKRAYEHNFKKALIIYVKGKMCFTIYIVTEHRKFSSRKIKNSRSNSLR